MVGITQEELNALALVDAEATEESIRNLTDAEM